MNIWRLPQGGLHIYNGFCKEGKKRLHQFFKGSMNVTADSEHTGKEDFMKLKMKKMTAVLMSAVMILGLAGCGSQSSQNGTSAVLADGGNAETESTPVSEQPSTAENTAEATTEIVTDSSEEATAEAVTDSLEEATTEIMTDSSEEATTEIMTGNSEETSKEALSDSSTEEAAELSAPEGGFDIAESEIESGKALVVYYSATGTTEKVANYIAAATDADLFELEPVNPYSPDDLNYSNENSRVVYEHDNPEARVVALVSSTVDNWDSYDTVFIGFPIWWRIAAWPVDGFVAANDFTGKTVIPFCTSSSSGLGESGELLAEAAGTGNWLAGGRFSSSDSAESVQAWIESLGIFL